MIETLRTYSPLEETSLAKLVPSGLATDSMQVKGSLEGLIEYNPFPELEEDNGRVVIVSNRLPANFEKGGDGKLIAKPTFGGLVTAMTPILNGSGREGVWIGWPGTTETEGLEEALLTHADKGINMIPVTLSEEDQKTHYNTISNEFLWPLLHATTENALIEKCRFPTKEEFDTYNKVQSAFAQTVKEQVRPGDRILIQDYHLFGTAKALREMGMTESLGFFLHIPFPPVEILQNEKLNKKIIENIIKDLTYYDHVGFQTEKDLRNFYKAVETFLPNAKVDREQKTIEFEGRVVNCGDYLISMDVKDYKEKASEPEVFTKAESIKNDFPNVELLLAGGRLDYTKGFDYLLEGLEFALEEYPDLINKLSLILYTPPSRQDVPVYADLYYKIKQLVERVNNNYGEYEMQNIYDPTSKKYIRVRIPVGWQPVIHLDWGLKDSDQLGMIYAKTIGIYPSVADGANLMAQEDAIAGTDDNLLMLGKEAGTFIRMQDGVLAIDPLDKKTFAKMIYEAVTMSQESRKEKLQIARAAVEGYTIYDWAHAIMRDLEKSFEKRLSRERITTVEQALSMIDPMGEYIELIPQNYEEDSERSAPTLIDNTDTTVYSETYVQVKKLKDQFNELKYGPLAFQKELYPILERMYKQLEIVKNTHSREEYTKIKKAFFQTYEGLRTKLIAKYGLDEVIMKNLQNVDIIDQDYPENDKLCVLIH